jgi:hypothetical protein
VAWIPLSDRWAWSGDLVRWWAAESSWISRGCESFTIIQSFECSGAHHTFLLDGNCQ